MLSAVSFFASSPIKNFCTRVVAAVVVAAVVVAAVVVAAVVVAAVVVAVAVVLDDEVRPTDLHSFTLA